MAVNTGTALKEKGLLATFMKASEGAPSMFQKFCLTVNSNAEKEKHAWLGMPPAVREFRPPRHANRFAETTYEIVNKKWEATLRIDQDDIDDDQTNAIMTQVGLMAGYAGRHKDELFFGTTIPNANAVTCFDGQYFYDTDHAYPEAEYTTSQDNDRTTNITTTSAPTTREAHAALKDTLQQFRLFKDDRGKPLNPMVGGITIECPPHHEFIWKKMMSANMLGIDAATHAEDGVMWSGMINEVIVNPYMSNTDRFRAHLLNDPMKPFIFQNRKNPIVQYIRADDRNPDYGAFMTDSNYFGWKARYNFGYGHWCKSILHIFT